MRAYVFLVDEAGNARAFVKVSFDDENDSLLERESQALSELESLSLQRSYQPRILDGGVWSGHNYLAFETIPATSVPLVPSMEAFPEALVKEYAGDVFVGRSEEVAQLDWWRTFERRGRVVPEFYRYVHSTLSDGMALCRVHGDFGIHNMVAVDKRIWIFDWENSSRCAPCLTDRLRFWISLHERRIMRKPSALLGRFLQNNRVSSDDWEARIAHALAYLHASGNETATQLIRCWPFEARRYG